MQRLCPVINHHSWNTFFAGCLYSRMSLSSLTYVRPKRKKQNYKTDLVQTSAIFTNPPVRLKTPLDCEKISADGSQSLIIAHMDRENVRQMDENISSTYIASEIKNVAQSQYQTLVSTIPWLQANSSLAYVQLVLKDHLETAMAPVVNDENFIDLCGLLEEKVNHLSHKELAETFLCLLYMGFRPTSSLVHKMLFKCKMEVREYDWYTLSIISIVNKALKRNDHILIREIAQRHVTLLKDKKASFDDLYAHCVILLNTSRFYSSDLMTASAKLILQSLDTHDASSQLSGEEITTLVQVLAQMNTHMSAASNHEGLQILSAIMPIVSNVVLENVEKFDPIHLRLLKRNLVACKLYSSKHRHEFESKISEICTMYQANLQLDTAANLLCVLSKKTDRHISRQIENVLYKKLHENDIDIVTLSQIAQALAEIDTSNSDLLSVVQDHIIEKGESLLNHATRFRKIFYFLLTKQFISPSNRIRMTELVIQSLQDSQNSFMNDKVSRSVAVLIPNTSEPLPKIIMHRLLSSIPKWDVRSLHHFIVGLNSLRFQKLSHDLQQQIGQLYSLLYVTVLQSKGAVDSFRNLNMLTSSFVIHNQQQDPEVTEVLMECHIEHAAQASQSEMLLMMKNCSKTRYFNETLYEKFTESILKQEDSSTKLMNCNKLISLLALAGYEPKRCTDLIPLVLESMVTDLEDGNLYKWLYVVRCLTALECFPEEPLKKLFTLSFLEKIDNFCQANPDRRSHVERLVAEINRSTFIEAPHLNTPWFSESFLKSYFSNVEAKREACPLEVSVDNTLRLVLGGKANFRSTAHSPYYHKIDFECILDQSGRVLPWKSGGINTRTSIKRVAIQLIREFNCTLNGQRITGYKASDLRQLEILGYHVVRIPHYEWNSMGLADPKSKREYLRNKIF